MRLFNDYWFRYFAGGFLFGASVVSIARATGHIKDFKLERVPNGLVFSENQTWAIFCALVGVLGGTLGLGAGGTKKLFGGGVKQPD